MMTTVKIAARRWWRSSIAPATTMVITVIPAVANAVSISLRGWRGHDSWTAHASSGSPRLSISSRAPVVGDQHGDACEQGEAQQCPAQGDEARSVEHTDPFGGGGAPSMPGAVGGATRPEPASRLRSSGAGPRADSLAP